MDNRCDRRAFVRRVSQLCGAAPLAALGAQAHSARVHRIGFLTGNEPSLVSAFHGELRRLGHIDGQNVVIESRLPEPNLPMSELAAELAKMDLALVVAGALPHALEIRRHNPAMPMVIATCPGMISNGFAKSLEHPGGNVTGMDELPAGITAKRLTLLKRAVPSVSRVALLSTTPGKGGHEIQLVEAERTAPTLGITVKPYRVSSLSELQSALTAIVADGMNGLANFQGGRSIANRQMIVDFAASRRLPAVYQATLFAEAGGLMAWAPDLVEQFRIAAGYVDRILNGANPGDLPIRHPDRYFWTVNQTAAKGLGLTLSPSVLAQADRVIS